MNAVYVPGYTLEDQRAGRPMTIAQALDIAELASPNPWSAAHALRTLRQALEQATTTLSEVRDAAGAECTYPFADLPQVVAALRKAGIAIPAVLAHTRCTCTQRGPDLFCSKCSGALFDLPDAPVLTGGAA